jgi:hypothetical protein
LKFIPSLYFALALLAASCAAPPDLTHITCPPPPEPQCNPGISHAQGIDTSHVQPGNFKYHIDLLPAPINSDENENAIAFYNNKALLSAEGKNNWQDILISEMLPDLHFKQPFEFIDNKNFAVAGAACYCLADKSLYFTAKADNDDPNDYDLYSARILDDGSEKKPEGIKPVTILNKKNNFDAQPAISKDGLMIVFASDRGGGHGGVDLWYSTRTSINTEWAEPKILPSEINTPCDELSPSFSADGKKLYFSSDGHETIGGYDIFSSEYKNGLWSQAENIGSPINTKSDEIFPYQLSDSQFFYTSDQPAAFKGRNIVVLRRTLTIEKIYTPGKQLAENNMPDSVQINGKVELPLTLDTVLPEVFVRDVQIDSEIARKKTDENGNFSFRVKNGKDYDVGLRFQNAFYIVRHVNLQKNFDSIIAMLPLTVPDTLILRINFPFNDDSHPYDFVIDERGLKSDVRWESSLDIIAQWIKNSYSILQKVVINGHTDSLGTDKYNFDLAKRRADFIVKQLERRGVTSKLFTIISKGRTQPLGRIPNESDETYQLRCRRVEFIKVFKKENKR